MIVIKRPVTLFIFEDGCLSWGAEVLLQGLIIAERPVTLFTLEIWCVSWGVEVLLWGMVRIEEERKRLVWQNSKGGGPSRTAQS